MTTITLSLTPPSLPHFRSHALHHHHPPMSILRHLNLIRRHHHPRRLFSISAAAVRQDSTVWTPAPLTVVHPAAESLFHVTIDVSDSPDLVDSYTRAGQYLQLRLPDVAKPSFLAIASPLSLAAARGEFYEWKKDGSKKQPYYVHFKDGRPLVFAALYDSWKNSEEEILYTFTIVTTSSSPALEWLHDRMPVILGDKESTETWLIGSSSSKFDTVLKPYEAVWYPVTPAIGKASFDGPECIKEIKLKSEATYPISKFFSKKGANSEQESKPQVGSMHKLPIKTNQRKSLKEEPETEDDVDCPSLTEESSDGSKPNVSTLSDKAAANLPIKREYEEFSADMKPCIGETNKPQISPPKKKGNLGAAGHTTTPQFTTTGRHRRQNPLLLFPSRTVLPFRLLLRLRHHPTNTAELEKREIVMEPLFSILQMLLML
ncbi:hypothetical protein TEA_021596 [Camellia sinensis var. sinensis]|uniref:FAD-binding FR-type domain-containing protein n=1 Tax=Camellia sinensis var. sinensis TaxID=542762 RepID=A0A4S4D177_CAMSN|nr:hypothetical protein TEA_021596 [Camellia sinensis var. sinensis]